MLDEKALLPSNVRMQYALSQTLRYANEDHELEEFFDDFLTPLPSNFCENGDFTPVGMYLIRQEILDYCLSQLLRTRPTSVTSNNLARSFWIGCSASIFCLLFS
jgi:hypothetical protein